MPLTLHSLEGKYATALFTAASKQNSLDAVHQEIGKIGGFLQRNESFRGFIMNPAVSAEQKRALVTDTLKKQNYSVLTVNFFELLAGQGRLGEVERVMKAFDELVKAQQGELDVEIISAKVRMHIARRSSFSFSSTD